MLVTGLIWVFYRVHSSLDPMPMLTFGVSVTRRLHPDRPFEPLIKVYVATHGIMPQTTHQATPPLDKQDKSTRNVGTLVGIYMFLMIKVVVYTVRPVKNRGHGTHAVLRCCRRNAETGKGGRGGHKICGIGRYIEFKKTNKTTTILNGGSLPSPLSPQPSHPLPRFSAIHYCIQSSLLGIQRGDRARLGVGDVSRTDAYSSSQQAKRVTGGCVSGSTSPSFWREYPPPPHTGYRSSRYAPSLGTDGFFKRRPGSSRQCGGSARAPCAP